METLWIRVVSQLGIYATFALYLVWAVRRGSREWIPFVGTAIYAVVFEHFNMLRYAQSPGGYHYYASSWLWVWGDVPLYIPLAWAFIVATSRAITDELGLKAWARPFCDALLALLIDLSLDAVAIRLHCWYWHGVGIKDGFFGVPSDNFVGWLLVTFTFCFLTRRFWGNSLDRLMNERGQLQTRLIGQWVLIPIFAYLLYLAIEAGVHLAYRLFHADTLRMQLYVLGGILIAFLTVTMAGAWRADVEANEKRSDERWRHVRMHGPRHIFHIAGVIGLLCIPAALSSPGLWVLALTVWTVEALVAWRVHHLGRKRLG